MRINRESIVLPMTVIEGMIYYVLLGTAFRLCGTISPPPILSWRWLPIPSHYERVIPLGERGQS